MSFNNIQFQANSPIYLQIAAHVKHSIVSGEFLPGQRLDSVRDFALRFEVNPNTMQRALSALESEGLLRSERTAGRFITEDTTLITNLKQKEADEIIVQFIEQMKAVGYGETDMINRLQAILKEGASHE